MKHILRLLAAVAVILFVACACEKEGVQRFKGNYTFKTGGTLTVKTLATADEPADPENPTDGPTEPDGQTEQDGPTEQEEPDANEEEPSGPAEELSTMAIASESGQMDIVVTGKSAGSMIVTMNIIGGTVVTFDAVADGKILTLSPLSRQITLNPANYSSDAVRPVADVEISGYGERFDNIIIFRLEYHGSYIYAGKEYEIIASSIDCVAKQNNN